MCEKQVVREINFSRRHDVAAEMLTAAKLHCSFIASMSVLGSERVTFGQTMLALVQTVAVCLLIVIQAGAETHWMVTEDGVKAMSDSPYTMAQPHDLVQFLRQEARVRKAEEAKNQLINQKNIIDTHESQDDPQIESRLMETDQDCIAAGTPLPLQELFMSTAVPFEFVGIKTESLIGESRSAQKLLAKEPFCSHYYRLGFSMAAFPHLETVANLSKLSCVPERALQGLLFPDWPLPSDYGHVIAEALEKHPRSWVLYTLASYYWRYMGNGEEAVECLRRALHFTSRKHIAIPLLSLINVLHHGQSKDAATVADVALAFNNTVIPLLVTSAHVYAVTGQYEKSVAMLEKVLNQTAVQNSDFFAVAQSHLAALKCHRKLEIALEAQHENLKQVLTELQLYQLRLKNLQKVNEESTRYVVDPETRKASQLLYAYFTYGPIDGLECNIIGQGGRAPMISCSVTSLAYYQALHQKMVDEGNLLHVVNQTLPVDNKKPNIVNWQQSRQVFNEEAITLDRDKEERFLNALRPYRNLMLNEPTKPKVYPIAHTDADRLAQRFWDNNSWPSVSECAELNDFKIEPLDSFFLSPENKGFDVTALLTSYLNLKPDDEHPLPWYPPFCTPFVNDVPNLHLLCCDHLLGVQRAKSRSRRDVLPEAQLRNDFLELVNGSSSPSDAEIGQRILTLLKQNIGPKWLLYNLAALYWRMVGITVEAVACLRLALAEKNGIPYADVALFQLSYLSYVAGGRLDDAVSLIHQAIEIDNSEPLPQYLLGYYLALKRNWTGAVQHLRSCLEADPSFEKASKIFAYVRCKQFATSFPNAHLRHMRECSQLQTDQLYCGKDVNNCLLRSDLKLSHVSSTAKLICPNCLPKSCFSMPPTAVFIANDGPLFHIVGHRHHSADQAVEADCRGAVSAGDWTTLYRNGQLFSLADASYSVDPAEKIHLRFSALQSLLSQQNSEFLRRSTLSGEGLVATVEKSLLRSEIFDNDFVVRSRRLIADNPLPQVVPEPPVHMVLSAISMMQLPLSSEDCSYWLKRVNIEQATSTWLSISAKGINIRDFIDFDVVNPGAPLEPVCELDSYGYMWTMDHLQGYVMRDDNSLYKPERGLLQFFQNFSCGAEDSVNAIASKIALAMDAAKNDHNKTWILATAAALYWRVVGNSSMAIQCLRHSILHAPYNMKDLGLISLANVYHQNGWLHSALIAAGAAMHISPKFVVVHFTLANIYAALGNFDRAVGFYFSTLDLQGSFEPAKERIRALFCTVGSEAAAA